MRYAIFSDVHNHTDALKQVINDAQTRAVDAFYCLGDVGIDACVNLVREINAPTVFGNWEASNWRYLSPENRQWVLNLPPVIRDERFWLTHAAPFWPPPIKTLADLHSNAHIRVKGNLFPYLHYEENSLWECIALLTEAKVPLMFHGHTHRQLVWQFTNDNRLLRLHKPTVELAAGTTLIVGVGSVGRPMDRPGAAYVIFDAGTNLIELARLRG